MLLLVIFVIALSILAIFLFVTLVNTIDRMIEGKQQVKRYDHLNTLFEKYMLYLRDNRNNGGTTIHYIEENLVKCSPHIVKADKYKNIINNRESNTIMTYWKLDRQLNKIEVYISNIGAHLKSHELEMKLYESK